MARKNRTNPESSLVSRAAKAGGLLFCLLALIMPATLGACGSDRDDVTGSTQTTGVRPTAITTTTPPTTSDADPSVTDIQLAMSMASRLAPSASQADLRSAADSVQAFGLDLYGLLAVRARDGNLVFSPSSIVTALAMTYAGAAGSTAEEMAKVLHFALEDGRLHQAFNSLDATLESRSWERKNPDGTVEGILVKTANSLWGQKDTVFEQIFLDTLAANYSAGIRLVDYKTAAEGARRAINAWVAGETNNKITDLIPAGALDTLTRLVLVNAVYLDATWAAQFDPMLTTDGPFTTPSGANVTARMMRQRSSFPYARGDVWQAVELPYVGGQMSMLLIVPDQGHLAEIEKRITAGLLDEAASAMTPGSEVVLTMPKFEFRTQTGLKDALIALGMTTAFNPMSADFSGMTRQESLFISDVIHEAYIAVDEEGTEAAAATAVVMTASGMPLDVVELTIDRPFLFALRDKETGAVLFLGRVADPTA